MKIPFDIKYRPQIESGEYKVCIDYDWPVEILSWDCIHVNKKGKRFPILAKITCLNPGEEEDFVHWYNNEGKYDPWDNIPSTTDCVAYCPGHDLFIVTPEEELTEFEKAFLERVFHQKAEDLDEQNKEIFLEDARYVLALAHEQFIKDGYVIEKKAFHDAVENISDKHRTEMSVQYSLHCKIEDGTRHAIMNWSEFQKVAQKFIDIGKAEALKDLPIWKKDKSFEKEGTFMGVKGRESFVVKDGYSISVAELIKKLPGFKED